MANELQAQPQNRDIAAYMADVATKNYIAKAVGESNAQTFVSSIISAVQATPALKQCTNSSIVSAALLGNSLNLSPSPQMGFYYMVPYDNKNLGVKEAQFQMGLIF
ncbi:MAG: recombinase RecT [Bariatricus sp.]